MRSLLFVPVLLLGCASSADVQKARTSRYQTSFDTVWNAISAEMGEQYRDQIKVSDKEKGQIITGWKRVETVQEDTEGETNARNNSSASATVGSLVMRMMVTIEGPQPWRVVIDGEAAKYKPGMSTVIPYAHGAIDEPGWVPARIDALYVDIHDRLKSHAAIVETATTQPVTK